jgi:hypothetical protein
MTLLDELRETGRMTWTDQHRGWLASPEDIVDALTSEGFEEYKREMAWTRSGETMGGIRQGQDLRTGAVACAIWVNCVPAHRRRAPCRVRRLASAETYRFNKELTHGDQQEGFNPKDIAGARSRRRAGRSSQRPAPGGRERCGERDAERTAVRQDPHKGYPGSHAGTRAAAASQARFPLRTKKPRDGCKGDGPCR